MKSVTQGNQICLPPCVSSQCLHTQWGFLEYPSLHDSLKYKPFLQNAHASHAFIQGKKDKTGFLQCLTALTEQPKATFLAASFWLCSPPLGCMLPPVRSQICSPPQHWRIPLQCCALEALGVQWGWKDSSPACSWDILVWVSFPAPIKTGPACQAGLASSKQPHLCQNYLNSIKSH